MSIFLFGATGFTGQLTARALHRRGAEPVLVGRSPQKLQQLSDDLDGSQTAVADAGHPQALAKLLGKGDVLVSTVGPFMSKGWTALRAAMDSGATYLDSTGEPAFVRHIFEDAGPRAHSPLLTAFGYDYVPGNLAGALALQEAGDDARHVEVGYFFTGGASASSGTIASGAGMLAEPSHAYRKDQVVKQRAAARAMSFATTRGQRQAISIGGTEHWQLPRLQPQLESVDVGVGWFGKLSPLLSAWSAVSAPVIRLPPVGALAAKVSERLSRTSGSGPDEASRLQSKSLVIALALDGNRRPLAEITMTGPDGYTLTADLLAWGAQQAAGGQVEGIGALGPVDAFGLDELREGAASCGLTVV